MKRFSRPEIIYPLTLILLSLLLANCASSPATSPTPQTPVDRQTSASIESLLTQSRASDGPQAADYLLNALELMLASNQISRAENTLENIVDPSTLPVALQIRYAMARAGVDLQRQRTEAAVTLLSGELVQAADSQSLTTQSSLLRLRIRAYRANGQLIDAAKDTIELAEIDSTTSPALLHNQVWDSLRLLSLDDLDAMSASSANYETRGWVELAKVIKVYEHNIQNQLDALDGWRQVWMEHRAATALPAALASLQQIWDQRPRHIALLLPLQSQIGNAILEGFVSAYYEALDDNREVPRISIFDTTNLDSIFPTYEQAVDADADLIIGPFEKDLVRQLNQRRALPVPTLALNYADSASNPDTLYQFGLAPEDDIRQLADLAWQAGHRNAGLMIPASADYERIQNLFVNYWLELGGKVVSQVNFDNSSDYSDVVQRLMAIDSSTARAQRLRNLLPRNTLEFTPRRRQDVDFIFLVANPRQGRQIKPTLSFHYAGDVPVYAMPSIYDGRDNESQNRDLNGIVFTDAPWVLADTDPLKPVVTQTLRSAQGPLTRLRAMGIDSFRLHSRLPQLENGTVSSLPGTTGTLTVSADRLIHRISQQAEFVNGIARSID